VPPKIITPTEGASPDRVLADHIIADDEITAKKQLDEKGGIVTRREVKLVNTDVVYGEGNLDPK
jgi:hypothetical protein